MSEDLLLFEPEDDTSPLGERSFWNILIVDDDAGVHTFTKLALHDFSYESKGINFISVYSAAEAQEYMEKNSDIAVILLDVVMETDSSGLDLVNVIRHKLFNNLTRIIIRTGQAGKAPERYVIDHYDISDYREKTELTADKLYTTIRTALSQYHQLAELLIKKNEIYNTLITDNLTHTGNRTKLNFDLNTENSKSLVLFNIDSFSMINDVYGFDVGDQLLMQFKNLLVKITDPKWEVYRLESDIFAMLCSSDESLQLLEEISRVKEIIASHYFLIFDSEYRINVTVSIVQNETINLIQKAEIALHEARNLGRNRIQVYSENLNILKQVEKNTQWTKWIKEALDNNRIIAYFQPIVECKTDKVVKYETLVRLEKDGVVHSPCDFLPTARYAGLLYQITKAMFLQACIHFEKNELRFSVNITDQDLVESDFINYIEDTREKYSISPSRISFEILEESSILNDPTAQKHLHKLTELGYGLALDDFGVQCSNFAQIGDLSLESIKIDGIYIKDIIENSSSRIVTDTILYFTKKIGVTTIAEFVHSEEVYNTIKEMGVDYAQGYFLGKPQAQLLNE
ncbi:EAL domain-containing protein [Sulfurimonas aquatica]|uniref:EAL domain-containing protein n=1 Tax=Sulfurimonas aquatica TaxID=2672570 RepID=A0A975GD65_9BACT|nr:EAL domain-containing protein [Sulfurimonas aquatica]QSZ42411.1 EAL domain-containing protein [Sulfurimonas aquatica]